MGKMLAFDLPDRTDQGLFGKERRPGAAAALEIGGAFAVVEIGQYGVRRLQIVGQVVNLPIL